MSDDLRITVRHAQALGLCLSGCRAAAPSLGLDFRRFVLEGILVSEVADHPDLNIRRMVVLARKEAEQDGW